MKVVIGDSTAEASRRRVKELSSAYDFLFIDGAHDAFHTSSDFGYPELVRNGCLVQRVMCFAFNRDGTVDTSKGPVPLELVKRLAGEHVVYAIGNQKLCEEAGIPGVQVEKGRAAEGVVHAPEGKVEALEKIRARHPNCARYIVVDDNEIEAEGWEYQSPHNFVKEERWQN